MQTSVYVYVKAANMEQETGKENKKMLFMYFNILLDVVQFKFDAHKHKIEVEKKNNDNIVAVRLFSARKIHKSCICTVYTIQCT